MKDFVVCYMTYHTGRYFKMYLVNDSRIVRSHSFKKSKAKRFNLSEARIFVNINNHKIGFDSNYFIENFSEYIEED